MKKISGWDRRCRWGLGNRGTILGGGKEKISAIFLAIHKYVYIGKQKRHARAAKAQGRLGFGVFFKIKTTHGVACIALASMGGGSEMVFGQVRWLGVAPASDSSKLGSSCSCSGSEHFGWAQGEAGTGTGWQCDNILVDPKRNLGTKWAVCQIWRS